MASCWATRTPRPLLLKIARFIPPRSVSKRSNIWPHRSQAPSFYHVSQRFVSTWFPFPAAPSPRCCLPRGVSGPGVEYVTCQRHGSCLKGLARPRLVSPAARRTFSVTQALLLDEKRGEIGPPQAQPQPPPLPTPPASPPPPPNRTPHEQIWNLPNTLTFTRLAAAPAVGYLILTSQPTLALTLFIYAGITDLIDGHLARTLNQQTVVGTVIDPMADKALMTISVVALALQGGIPVWLAALILARDLGLAAAAIYIRWISLPPPKTMARYWDFSLPSAEVRPTAVSKLNTFLQLLLVGLGMAMPVLPAGVVE